MNPALMAETLEFKVMMRQAGLIFAARAVVPLISYFALALAIDQGEITVRKWRIDFLARQHLNRDDVEIECAQQIESLLIGSGGHQEVRNENCFAWPAQSLQMIAQTNGQIDAATWCRWHREVDAIAHAAPAAIKWRRRAVILQQMELDMIVIRQDHVSERQCDVACR